MVGITEKVFKQLNIDFGIPIAKFIISSRILNYQEYVRKHEAKWLKLVGRSSNPKFRS